MKPSRTLRFTNPTGQPCRSLALPACSTKPTSPAFTRSICRPAHASFAVNLDPLESKTSPLHVETIEQLGVRLASHSRQIIDREQVRQMYNAELEGRQKLWRWLILAVLGILIFETWLAGRTIDRSPSTSRGGFDDMSTELRRALEQVARRFRHVRLWSGLTVLLARRGPSLAYAFGSSARARTKS